MKRGRFNFNCPNKVSEFFQKNSGIIVKSLALAIVSVLIKDLGLSDFTSPRLQFGSEKTENEEKKTPYNSRFMMPPSDTPIKETIAGLWTNGLTEKSDFLGLRQSKIFIRLFHVMALTRLRFSMA